MLLFSRRFFLFLLLVGGAVGPGFSAPAPADATAPAVAQGLCDALLAAMKAGATQDFAGRKAALTPEIERDFDLPFMTRIIVGPPWADVPAADGQALVAAFSDYTISTYAQRFSGFGGEHFEVDPNPTPMAKGNVVVHTKLFTDSGSPIALDYLMRKTPAGWQIIDIYLSGTISELATRRSEYSAILRKGGAPALADLLKKKTAELTNPPPAKS